MRQISEITHNEKPLQDILDTHKKWYTNDGGERAYLSGAHLSRADLSGADLSGANLSRAVGVYSFGPIGKEGRIGYAVASADGPMFALGCHWDNLENTCQAIITKYGEGSLYEKQVMLAAKILGEKP